MYCSECFEPSSPRGGFQGSRILLDRPINGARNIPEAPSKAVGNVRFHHSTLSRERKILLYPFRELRNGPRGANALSRFFRTSLRMVSTMDNPCCRGCLLHLSTQLIWLSVRYSHQDLHWRHAPPRLTPTRIRCVLHAPLLTASTGHDGVGSAPPLRHRPF